MIAQSPLLLLLAAASLAALGSFFGAVASRFETARGLLGRSACDACGGQLKSWHLVPLFSWLALRGRCAYCGAPIGWKTFIFEAAPPAAFMVALMLGAAPPHAFLIGVLAGLCWGVIEVDARTLLIPDIFTALIALAGVLALVVAPGATAPVDGLAGAALGGGLLWLTGALYARARGRQGLGFGDVKLAAAAGLWTGASGFGLYLLASSLFGAAYWRAATRRAVDPADQAFAFGPAMAAALALFALARLAGGGRLL